MPKTFKPTCATLSTKEDYVTHIAAGEGTLAVALSDNTTKLLDRGSLVEVHTLRGHTDAITGIALHPDTTLFTSSLDGSVRRWDSRSGRQAQLYSSPLGPHFGLDVTDVALAGGGRGSITFWDCRSDAQLATFTETHEDDVVQVLFHPEQPTTLLSASEDGNAAVFNLSGGWDEEAAFRAAANFSDAVTRLGFYGERKEKAWCLTGTQGLALWEWEAACDEEAEGGGAPFADIRDAREQLSASSSGISELANGLDYLLDCHYDVAKQRLHLAAGTNDGSVAVFAVDEAAARSGGSAFTAPSRLLAGAHTAVVRDMAWPDSVKRETYVTGGEDGRVACWRRDKSDEGSSGTKRSRANAV